MPAVNPLDSHNPLSEASDKEMIAYLFARESDPRQRILLAGLGLKAETFPISAAQNATVLSDGAIFFVALGLKEGDVVSNVHIAVVTAGADVTVSKLGLYSSAGVLLAVSEDQGTSWQTAGKKTVAMIAPYIVPSDGLYYAAVLAKATTTLPSLLRSFNNTVTGAVIGANLKQVAIQLTQTDLVTPATLAAGTNCIWFGVS